MSTQIQKKIKFDLGEIRRKVQLQIDKEGKILTESEIQFLEIEAISEWIERTFIEKRPFIHIAYDENGGVHYHSEKIKLFEILGTLKMVEHFVIKNHSENNKENENI